jgi:hypothetical protein
MPIRREHRFFYPIDWPRRSVVIRFGRAKGYGRGRRVRIASGTDILGRARRTRVVLAAAHRHHDTSNNADANLAAFCQRRHMIYDRPE